MMNFFFSLEGLKKKKNEKRSEETKTSIEKENNWKYQTTENLLDHLIIYAETKTVFVKEIVKYFESLFFQRPFRVSLNSSEENSNGIVKMLVNVLFDVFGHFAFDLLFLKIILKILFLTNTYIHNFIDIFSLKSKK